MIKLPYFNVDDMGWMDAIKASAEPTTDEGQPTAEPEVEALEEESEVEQEQDVETDVDPEVEKEVTEEKPTLDDEAEIDLGEGRQPVKLAELKSGYLRQSDYTKKTQELATQRKEVETQLSEVEPLRGMKTFLDSNPWLANQINTFIQEFSQTGAISLDDALQDAQYGQYINSLLAHTQKLEKELSETKGKYGELEFGTSMDKVVSGLRAEYGDLLTEEYESQLRERAKSQSLSSDVVKEIAEGHLSKQKLQQQQSNSKKTKRDIESKTVQSLQETKTKLPTPKSNGQRPSQVTKPVEEMSWIEAIRAGVK